MKRVFTALASVLFLAPFASAQTSTEVGSPVPSFAFIGSGCAEGNEAVDYHWEGSTLVVNFSGLSATKGPGVSLVESRKNCSLTMDLKVPKGLKYALTGYTVSGHDYLNEGDTRTITLSNFFQGQSKTGNFETVVSGAQDKEFRVSGTALKDDIVWSPCGVQRAHTINTAVRLNTSNRQESSFSTIDSVRLRFRLGLCLPETQSGEDEVSILPAG